MVEIQNLIKSFGRTNAVNDLSFDIPDGKIFGLLGPNGSGKSTLIRMLIGLIRPTSGSITLFNQFSPIQNEIRPKIGYMPQELAIYKNLTVMENLNFFGKLYGLRGNDLKERCKKLTDTFELSSKLNVPLMFLSGGMVRRTLLATAVIHSPDLLILDEPTAGVDPLLRVKIWDWLCDWCNKGTSVLVTTHHISEADRCDLVLILQEGKKIEEGDPQQLMNKYHCNNLEEVFIKSSSESLVP